MLPQVVTVGPLTLASANGIVTTVTPTSGTALTLLAGATLDTPRRILLTYGNEGSARTLVLTGTNATGAPIQETLAVSSGAGGTVSSIQDFATVTKAVPAGGGWTAAVTLGTSGIASSPWKFVNFELSPLEMTLQIVTSGTVNYTIEYTLSNPNNNQNTMGGALGNFPTAPVAFADPTLVNMTGSAIGQTNGTFQAWRLTVNSQTNPGSVTATAVQAGITNN